MPLGTNGPDSITCNGTINAPFVAGNGADSLNIENGTVFQNGANIQGGIEADTFNFGAGTITINAGAIFNGDGQADTFNFLAGTIVNNSGTIRGSAGSDIFSIVGTLNNFGTLAGQGDVDTFTISGTLSNFGSVDLGGGADEVTVAAGGTFTNAGALNGAGGGDTLTIGGLFAGAGGTINLGTGSNSIAVLAGGVFETGATVNLGGGNTLTNAGTLSPGGSGAIGTTAISGTLVQTATGTLAVDVDAGTSDRINVTGPANIAGTVAVNLLSPSANSQQFTLVSAAGGLTNSAALVGGSPVVTYTLSNTATDLILGVALDYTAPGANLNTNQLAIATHLNQSLAAGGGGLLELLGALSSVPSNEAYVTALNQLSPEVFLNTQSSTLLASLGFSSSLMSCKVNGPDTASINSEGQCLWIAARARDLQQDGTRQQIGFDERAGQFSGGGQIALDGNWRLGFGLGYQNSSLETDSGASSDGDLLLGGVSLKYTSGPLLLAAAASGGRGWYDTTRRMNFADFTAAAEGEQDIDVLAGRLHASYVLGAPALYFKPLIDLNVTHTDAGRLTETGAGAANLIVNGSDETVFSVSPAIEVGTQWWWENGTLVRPYVRAGVTWFDDDTSAVSASFQGTPGGVDAFAIRTQSDDTLFDVSAGLDVINAGDTALRFGYDGHFGQDTEIHAVGVKGSAKF